MPIFMVEELAESAFPLMPFAEVDDPDFFGDGEMVRVSRVEEGEFLFPLEEPVETVTTDRRVIQMIDSTQLTPFQRIAVEQYVLHRKNPVEIARIISQKTPEMVHPLSIEVALACAFDKMHERGVNIN